MTQPEPLRLAPPGAQRDFSQLCTGCGDCALACPEGIIIRRENGAPVVSFAHGSCTFCGACAEACDTGALLAADQVNWPWRAAISDTCFSLSGISCRACEDGCDRRAIRFRLMTAGRAAPLIDPDACNGCGECAHICPTGAIVFQNPQAVSEAR